MTADSEVTFTGTIENTGSTSASGAKLTETIPSTAEFVSATPSTSGSSCTKTGSTLSCSLAALAAGASATVKIVLRPIEPGTLTNSVSVTQTGSTNTNSASASVTVGSAASTHYISVNDSGFSPTSLSITPGQVVQFNFFGPGTHSAKDGSPLALFNSGAEAPVSYYVFTYASAGAYPVDDADSSHTATVDVTDELSASSVVHGHAVTVTMASRAPASGYALDLEVLKPGSST